MWIFLLNSNKEQYPKLQKQYVSKILGSWETNIDLLVHEYKCIFGVIKMRSKKINLFWKEKNTQPQKEIRKKRV